MGLKVLGRATSINVRKILWAADEMGLNYEREDWGMPLRDPHEPAFLALNPNALVPVIIEDHPLGRAVAAGAAGVRIAKPGDALSLNRAIAAVARDLPAGVVEKAKVCILDLLGIAAAGFARDNAQTALRAAFEATMKDE